MQYGLIGATIAGQWRGESTLLAKETRTTRRMHYVPREINVELGNRVRHLRVNILGFDRQVDFAEKLGVTRGAVGNWELGRGIGRANIDHIAKTFNVSVDWLSAAMGAPVSDDDDHKEQSAGPLPTVFKRSQLLPPEDYERFWLMCEALLDAQLQFVQRQSVSMPKRKSGRQKVAKPDP